MNRETPSEKGVAARRHIECRVTDAADGEGCLLRLASFA